MGLLDMWSLVVGFLSPPFLAIVQQSGWSDAVRALVTFVYSCLVSLAVVYLQGPEVFTWHRWIEATLTVLITAIATYKGLWKPTGVAPKIETVTSPGAGGATQT